MTQLVKQTEQDVSKYLTAMGLVKDLTNQEVQQFTEICKGYGLNPFKREIYVTKYGSNFSIIVGYETYIKRAERSNLLQGWNVTTTGSVKDNSLKAIITIYRKDWQQPFIHEVYYAEYVQRTKSGEVNKFWREKPVTMTKKVAISQGFRMCFSDELGGMPYTAEEITDDQGYAEYVDISNQEPTGLKAAIDEINECNDMECLKATWTKYKDLQKNVEFINAKNEKKELLTNNNQEND